MSLKRPSASMCCYKHTKYQKCTIYMQARLPTRIKAIESASDQLSSHSANCLSSSSKIPSSFTAGAFEYPNPCPIPRCTNRYGRSGSTQLARACTGQQAVVTSVRCQWPSLPFDQLPMPSRIIRLNIGLYPSILLSIVVTAIGVTYPAAGGSVPLPHGARCILTALVLTL